jgi:muramoyltetrapeptide carboxypeptidase
MNKPKGLKKGDTIGIVSPASPSENKSELVRCLQWLDQHGYNAVVGQNVNKTKGFTAASEEERAADLNEMFARPDVDAVFCTQGGYGAAQLYRHLDFQMIRKNPKIFTGFSDITSLHLMFNKFCNFVTFHGPGIARFNSEELTDYTMTQFFKAVEPGSPLGRIPLADEKKWLNTFGKGAVEGTLIGGNLTLLCASLGTPFEPDCKGKILLIEEVEAEPWSIDHMLSHLRNSGKLADVAGIVVGECKDCVPFKYNPGYLCDTGLEDVLEYYLTPLGIPVLSGLPLGHTKDLATLPLGVRVLLDADKKTFDVLESGVI